MKNIADFITFRNLCLTNAETALRSAEALQNKNANHITYHLSTLALEEIGKVFIAWCNFNRGQNDDENDVSLALDDHTKKIFWAFWWETFGAEIINHQQIRENQLLASGIHKRRLKSLYTELTDSIPAAQKIPDEEVANIIALVKARLEIAKADEITDREESENIKLFMILSNDPEKRSFIFGKEGQSKLLEFGNTNDWVKWLTDKFSSERLELEKLLQNELNNRVFDEVEDVPKWKIKIKIISALHSVRQNILTEYNNTSEMFKLNKGGDNNTLLIDLTLNKHTPIELLWDNGYLFSRIFVIALNVTTNGFFWWHANVDLDKYYESIKDLESDKNLSASLVTNLQWPKTKSVLSLQQLQLTKMVNNYMVKFYNKPEFEPFVHYGTAVSMMAKNDIHLRIEEEIFVIFFETYKKCISKYQSLSESEDYKETGYFQISGMIDGKEYYDEIMQIGESLTINKLKAIVRITITEVLAIKKYLEIYLLTLAVRDYKGDSSLRICRQ